MPLGTAIHNIEITLGKGGQLARAVEQKVSGRDHLIQQYEHDTKANP